MGNYGTAFNIAKIVSHSHIYGPGTRFVVWFQGCRLACKGCWNQEMWSFRPNILLEREQLLIKILNTQDIEGVTFLGGEPMHQYDNLRWLLEKIKQKTQLDAFVYSGYEENEIAGDERYDWLFSLADILVLGRYVEASRNTYLQWRGSENQEVILFDQRTEGWRGGKSKNINEVELIIDEQGGLDILGYPDDELVLSFLPYARESQ